MRVRVAVLVVVASAGLCLAGVQPAAANHGVLLEGNCDSPVPLTTIVDKTACGDWDGDGRIGAAEDTDGADRIFGTLNEAIGPGSGAASGTGIDNNGRITVVGSGRFHETITITGLPSVGGVGNVTIEAAPGVDAVIDAVFQGDPLGGNATRQNGTGILVDAPSNSRVTLRNLTIRNFAIGIDVAGSSHVTIDDVRLENNLNFGVQVRQTARVTVTDSEVNATGFRNGVGVSTTVAPGVGIQFGGDSRGLVADTTVTGSFAAGIKQTGQAVLKAPNVTVNDNNPNLQGL